MVVPILFQFGCTNPVPSWLYQTCSIGSRRGQKRPLLLPWVKSYTHEGGHSLTHGSSSIPRWSLYLCHSCQLDPKSGSTRPWNAPRSLTKFGNVFFPKQIFGTGLNLCTRSKISEISQWQKCFSELKISNPRISCTLHGVRRSS